MRAFIKGGLAFAAAEVLKELKEYSNFT